MNKPVSPVVFLTVVLAALAFFVLPVALQPHSCGSSGNRKRCTANLKQIGLGFGLYQQKNMDELPDRDGLAFVSALYETGHVQDPGLYLCPSSVEVDATGLALDEKTCSYVGRRNTGEYRLTAELLAKFGSRTALAADRSAGHHGDVRNVLFADGHVEEVEEAEYQARYASILGE